MNLTTSDFNNFFLKQKIINYIYRKYGKLDWDLFDSFWILCKDRFEIINDMLFVFLSKDSFGKLTGLSFDKHMGLLLKENPWLIPNKLGVTSKPTIDMETYSILTHWTHNGER